MSSIKFVELFPGFNLNISENVVKTLQQRENIKKLLDKNLIVISKNKPEKTFVDDKNDIVFTDDDGEKVPVYGDNLVTGTIFNEQELKERNIPTRVIAKLIENQPKTGWKNTTQIIENLGLTSKQQEIIETKLSDKF